MLMEYFGTDEISCTQNVNAILNSSRRGFQLYWCCIPYMFTHHREKTRWIPREVRVDFFFLQPWCFQKGYYRVWHCNIQSDKLVNAIPSALACYHSFPLSSWHCNIQLSIHDTSDKTNAADHVNVVSSRMFTLLLMLIWRCNIQTIQIYVGYPANAVSSRTFTLLLMLIREIFNSTAHPGFEILVRKFHPPPACSNLTQNFLFFYIF